jgi:hypothetical protein
MELVGEPEYAFVEVELEVLLGIDADELPSPVRLTRGAECRDSAAAATPLEPNEDAATALFDEFCGRIGNDDTHQLTDGSSGIRATSS